MTITVDEWSRVLSAAHRASFLVSKVPEPHDYGNHVWYEILYADESKLVGVAHVSLCDGLRGYDTDYDNSWWTKAFEESLSMDGILVPRLFVKRRDEYKYTPIFHKDIKSASTVSTEDLQIIQTRYPGTVWSSNTLPEQRPFIACFDIRDARSDMTDYLLRNVNSLYDKMREEMSVYKAYLNPALVPLYESADISSYDNMSDKELEMIYSDGRPESLYVWITTADYDFDPYWHRYGTTFESFDRIRASAAVILLDDRPLIASENIEPWLRTVGNALSRITDVQEQTVFLHNIRTAMPQFDMLVSNYKYTIFNLFHRMYLVAYELDGCVKVLESNMPRPSTTLASTLVKFLLFNPDATQKVERKRKRETAVP